MLVLVLWFVGIGVGDKSEPTFDPTAPILLAADTAKVQAELKLNQEQIAKIKQLRQKATDMNDVKSLSSILNENQVKRLSQIVIRIRGGFALTMSDIAENLEMTTQQRNDAAAKQKEVVDKLNADLKAIRFKSDEDRRQHIADRLRDSGKALLEKLTDSQRERFRKLQGDEFKVDGVFSRP